MFTLAVAFALAAAAAAPPASQPAQSNERICRGGGQRTVGSHIRTRRRCLTAEQWQREDEAARSRPVPGLQVTEGQNDGRAPVQPR
ncbi:MAG TPA: hypothetical protein VEC11_12210 [Allosphingosinicella sp.]|nr:hypothetical protein [Allosphingosinicella sp.]